MISSPLAWIALTVCALAGGCASIGPGKVSHSHLSYGKAVQTAWMEGALLNIVRMRYQDTLVDLGISSISTQFTLEVGTTSEFGNVEGTGSANVSPFIAYSERPTITFIPQSGPDYLAGLASPIDITTLVTLSMASERVDPWIRLSVAEMNGIQNHLAARSSEFTALVELLEKMRVEQSIQLGFIEKQEVVSEVFGIEHIAPADLLEAADSGYRYVRTDDGYLLTRTTSVPALWIDLSSAMADQLLAILRLAKVPSGAYPIVNANTLGGGSMLSKTIAIRTRSIFEVTAFLSTGVRIPIEHRGLVPALAEGEAPQLGNTFVVHSSDQKPDTPGISVEYRGKWFHIRDSDLMTKSTFASVQILYMTKALPSDPNDAPVLTLPIN